MEIILFRHADLKPGPSEERDRETEEGERGEQDNRRRRREYERMRAEEGGGDVTSVNGTNQNERFLFSSVFSLQTRDVSWISDECGLSAGLWRRCAQCSHGTSQGTVLGGGKINNYHHR